MPKLKQEYSEADGWTRWVQPVMDGYKMACCDCGLVHDISFRVYVVTEREAGDITGGELLPTEHFRVQFKVRRNVRSTAAVRRTKAKPRRAK